MWKQGVHSVDFKQNSCLGMQVNFLVATENFIQTKISPDSTERISH